MDYKVKISPEANIEINEAIKYYNEINTKLSSELFNILFDNLEFIKNNPYSFTIKHRNIRGLPIEKYPYVIYYFIDEILKTVNVISVFNTHKDPDKWEKRV
ncbi:MAG: hypothetical protein B6I18_08520 [Bacteroidetes bacterium 4572_112]|nr:MAG: hypothetical protein B6I18_08520 [Bacteroidetes bacterium 4572_112]